MISKPLWLFLFKTNYEGRSRMKMSKVGIIILLVGVIVTCFGTSKVHAVFGFPSWDHTWIKLNLSASGYENAGPGLLKFTSKVPFFIHILTWEDTHFSAKLWLQDENLLWFSQDIGLYYVAGNPLDFIVWSMWGGGDLVNGDGFSFAFTIRIKGTPNNGSGLVPPLKNATFTSLGGLFVQKYAARTRFEAGGMKMTGSLVPSTFCRSRVNFGTPPCVPTPVSPETQPD
jgi:hypothetical protein